MIPLCAVADPGGARDAPLSLNSFIFTQFWQTVDITIRWHTLVGGWQSPPKILDPPLIWLIFNNNNHYSPTKMHPYFDNFRRFHLGTFPGKICIDLENITTLPEH